MSAGALTVARVWTFPCAGEGFSINRLHVVAVLTEAEALRVSRSMFVRLTLRDVEYDAGERPLESGDVVRVVSEDGRAVRTGRI